MGVGQRETGGIFLGKHSCGVDTLTQQTEGQEERIVMNSYYPEGSNLTCGLAGGGELERLLQGIARTLFVLGVGVVSV